MAARQKGSFSLGGTLEIKADAPADARLCVKTKSELTDANSFPYKYIGMIVSVADEGKAYILIASDTTVTANWKALGEGGSGGAGGLVDGYFNPSNSLFYKESTYTTPITGSTDMLYLSLDSGKLYYFNRTIFVVVTGDGSGGLVEGYYNSTNHLFYKESAYTTPISGERDKLYLSLDTNKLYYYNGSTFIVIAGEGGGGGAGGLTINATLTAAGWNNSTRRQTLTFAGYESSMGGVIGMPTSATAAQKEAYAETKINVVAQSGTSFTFECESIPSVDLPVTLYAGGGSGGSGGGAEAFTVTVTMDSGTGNLVADKTPKELEDAIAANAIIKADFPMYGLVLDSSVAAGGNFAFSTFYIENQDDVSTSAFATILMVKDTDSAWGSITMQTLQGDKFSKEVTCETDTLVQSTIHLNDFDHEEDTTNEQDIVSPHRLTSAEMADIMSTLPGAPTKYPKYSTTEQVVGEWIDGKPLYQKTVDTGALPNATTKNIPHNISNIDKVVNIFGFSLSGTSTMPLPYTASNSDSKLSVQVTSSLVNISITCGTNRSNQTVSYVTLQYTKTTD